jgi:hypothetical protein
MFDSTPIGDEGLVYLDTVDPDPAVSEATLRFGIVDKNGQLPAPGMVVQARAGLEYAPVAPALNAVLYTITSNTKVDGLYLNTKLQFTTVPTVPPPDGGTDATTTTDGGTDSAATEAGATDGAASDTGSSDAGSGDVGAADGSASDTSSSG